MVCSLIWAKIRSLEQRAYLLSQHFGLLALAAAHSNGSIILLGAVDTSAHLCTGHGGLLSGLLTRHCGTPRIDRQIGWLVDDRAATQVGDRPGHGAGLIGGAAWPSSCLMSSSGSFECIYT
jgi:hypothetical protein